MTPSSTSTPSTAAPGSATASSTQTNDSGAQAKVSRVAEEVPAQASRVVGDARDQVSDAAHRTMGDLRRQADDRAAQAASGLRGLSTQVEALANGRPEEAGKLTDVVQEVGRYAADFADRLDAGGVEKLGNDVARYGRQHPWAFLGLSLGAGFLVGRLVRTTAAVASDDQRSTDAGMSTTGSGAGATRPAPAAPAGTGHVGSTVTS